MTKKHKPPSWKPVLRNHGKVYCSPACGASCTKKSHDDAVKLSKKMVKELGAGWKQCVYENLGWHASAVYTTGHWSVYQNRNYNTGAVSYGAIFNYEADSSGGNFVYHANTPVEAVLELRKEVIEKLEMYRDLLAVVQESKLTGEKVRK